MDMFSCFLDNSRKKINIRRFFNARSGSYYKKFNILPSVSPREIGNRAKTPALKEEKKSQIPVEVLREFVEEKILKVKADHVKNVFEREVRQATDRYLNRKVQRTDKSFGIKNSQKLPLKKRVQVYKRISPINPRVTKTVRDRCNSDEFRIDENYFNKLYLSPTN